MFLVSDLVGCKPPDNRHRVPYMVVVMMINAYSSWSMTVAIALDLVLNRTSRQDFSRVRSARDEKRLDYYCTQNLNPEPGFEAIIRSV